MTIETKPRKPQKRTLETRARLIAAAEAAIAEAGYDALRVDEVARAAGVAKGTFFAHFRDKDALMDLLIGAGVDARLDAMEAASPRSVDEMVEALRPLIAFMTSERYVFDVILRHSGAAAREEIGPIATTFGRFDRIVARWLTESAAREDVPADLLAEGVQAFAVQAMALKFCALHEEESAEDRLGRYLAAWLSPAG
ncbi:MAG: TetR/AcrR family transcriptional regulator [Pseudomonadota bacterium]